MKTLRDYHEISKKQPESWTCGFYAIGNAMQAKANMMNFKRELDFEAIKEAYIQHFTQNTPLLSPIIDKIKLFQDNVISNFRINPVFIEIDKKHDPKWYDVITFNMATPIIVFKFNGRKNVKFEGNNTMVYLRSEQSRPYRFHTACVVEVTPEYLVLNDSAYGAISLLDIKDIDLIQECFYFGIKDNKLKLQYPTEGRTITQAWGENPEYYRQFGWRFHEGIDLKTITVKNKDGIGSNIYACHEGEVISTYYDYYAGNTIILRFKNITTSYNHLSEFKVKKGDTVEQGDIIGLSGNTGASTTGPHLHLSLYENGLRVNPMNYLV